MKTIPVRTWSGFQKQVQKFRKEFGVRLMQREGGEALRRENRVLFRGQSDSRWELQTTLERRSKQKFSVYRYTSVALAAVNEIETFTGRSWNTPPDPDLQDQILKNQAESRVHLPCYDYLVYLRHHGFPSPLLDWTESPFIAAYFAYVNAGPHNPAVYCYVEYPNSFKSGHMGRSIVTVQGPYVSSHKRHFAQKAWYTIATEWDREDHSHYFCEHGSVLNRDDPKQDLCVKIVLPARLRLEALRHLNDYNINHFTLFQSEDSLVKAIEVKEFDLGGLVEF